MKYTEELVTACNLSVILYHAPWHDGIKLLIQHYRNESRTKTDESIPYLALDIFFFLKSITTLQNQPFFCAVAMETIIRVQRDGPVSN